MDTCSVRGDTVSQTNVLSFARINVIYLPELGGQLPPLTPRLVRLCCCAFVCNNASPRHKHWPAGPVHFSDRRASSGQYILSFTGPYGPPRYMSGHQISNSAGPNNDKSHYVLFARAPAPHLGSFRSVLLLHRDASVARVRVGHVNQTY